jgi:hypothetical protein
MELAALVLTALVIPTLTAAQTSAAFYDGMRFTTGFSFNVDTTTLPAGSYTIRRASSNPGLLELRNSLTLKGALVIIGTGDIPRQAPYTSGVMFERRGNVYLLSGVWDTNARAAVSMALPPSGESLGIASAQPPERVMVQASKK